MGVVAAGATAAVVALGEDETRGRGQREPHAGAAAAVVRGARVEDATGARGGLYRSGGAQAQEVWRERARGEREPCRARVERDGFAAGDAHRAAGVEVLDRAPPAQC